MEHVSSGRARWTRLGSVASLALGLLAGAGVESRAQVGVSGAAPGADAVVAQASKRAPRFVKDLGMLPVTPYATGVAELAHHEERWRYICGSDTSKLTDEDLKRSVEEFERQFADPATIRVIDSSNGFQPRGSVNIVFNLSAAVPATAAASFAQAEAYIESQLSDPVTVTISVGWTNLGTGVIGSTGSTFLNNQAYSTVRTGLVNGMDPDDTLQAFLPSGSSFPAKLTSAGAIQNLSTVDVTRANYNSTIGNSSGNSASMNFNSTFNFDFDPSNGVSGGTLSLVDTIVHEVGHALGFVSGADDSPTDADLMDLFRFRNSTDNPSSTAQFTSFARFITFNDPTGQDVNTDLITAEYRMSDGSPNQASHFNEGTACSAASSIGIMDPTLCNSTTFYPNFFRTSDINVLDAMGWDVSTCVTGSIVTNPVNKIQCQGGSVTFTIVADGGPLTYQWRKNGVNIPSTNSDSYTIAAVVPADAGSYDCVVSTPCGGATSSAATLTVRTPPTFTTNPAGQSVCEGGTLVLTAAASGSPTPAIIWRKDGVDVGQFGTTLTITPVTLADQGTYTAYATNLCGDQTSSGAVVTVTPLPSISTHPSGSSVCSGSPASFSVAATGATGFQWRKDGGNISGATGSTYNFTTNPSSGGSYDCVVSNACGSVTSNAATLTVQPGPSISSQSGSTSLCAGQNASFFVVASNATGFQWRKDGGNISGATGSTYNFTTNASSGGSYDCVVTGPCGSTTSSPAVLTMLANPSFSSSPSSTSACVGSLASFSVAASNATSLQWRKNGVNIPGATGNTYSIASVALADAGTYDCVATNTCTSLDSADATLTVNEGPTITTSPGNLSLNAGDNANFTVAASGTPTLSYQWRKDLANLSDGGSVSGATTASLSITGVVAGDAGSYDCVVTNLCGSSPSSSALLTVSTGGCVADVDDGTGTGTPDGGVTIDDLIYFLGLFDAGNIGADVDDGSATGTPDGGVTIDDLIYYLTRFDAGC